MNIEKEISKQEIENLEEDYDEFMREGKYTSGKHSAMKFVVFCVERERAYRKALEAENKCDFCKKPVSLRICFDCAHRLDLSEMDKKDKQLAEANEKIKRLEECDICNKKASVHLCRECYNKKPALMAEDVKVLARYLNGWADCDKHPESSENGKITKYYEGYQQAVRDIIQKIGWERFEGWCGYDSKRKVQNKPTRKV